MSIKTAAAKAGMSEPTAHTSLRSGKLPSERDYRRTHRTRADVFEKVWGEVVGYLQENSGLEVKALFAHLQRKYPGQFKPGQLRTLQRRVKQWRVQEGPPK
ncbi:MAG: IS21 family transposase, partial [Bacteroidetes bacterium]|nr:IS21 family transposase [Bacteroidota bacterium]